MKHQKILNLLNEGSDSKFVTRKLNIVKYQWNKNYGVRNKVIYNTEVLQSNLWDYNEAFIFVNGDVTFRAAPAAQVSFENVHHLLNVSQKLMEQQQMRLKI